MGKADKHPIPSEKWISLTEAREIVTKALLSRELAERLILEALRAGLRWHCPRYDQAKRTEEPELTVGDPAFWQEEDAEVEYRAGRARQITKSPLHIEWAESWAKRRGEGGRYITIYRVMVPAAPLLEALHIEVRPPKQRMQEQAPEQPPPTHAKSGPKPTGDWPTVVAAWLIEVAVDDPKRLENVAALTAGAQDILQERIGWAPKETKELRNKIKELLQFISR